MYIADLHIHSRFSRATSSKINLENLSKWAKIKGINLLATGDVLHPLWLSELEKNLKEKDVGIYEHNGVDFILETEISTIYKDRGKLRKIHIVFLFPDFISVKKYAAFLSKKWNLSADGRPIVGLPVRVLFKKAMDIDERIVIIPAHIWTPWFSIFGSNSGYDSLEECCGNDKYLIDALETGLSSDPPMNWMVSELDDFALVSNSDAHSLENLGREVNVFSKRLNIVELKKVLREKNIDTFLYTIEFFPEEGKYHFDGHRNCNVSMSPEESIRNRNICPICGKKITLGVLHRVYELADRKYGEKPQKFIPYKRLIPLKEIISDVLKKGKNTKTVDKVYRELINHFNDEFSVLLTAKRKDLVEVAGQEIATAICNVRDEKVKVEPGYDGVYGKISVETTRFNNGLLF